MNYYISKNGKQLGPFTENDIIVKLTSGELSTNDLCIPQGGSEWKPISAVFPRSASASNDPKPAASVTPSQPPKKSRWKLVLGIFALLFVGFLLIGGVLGFFAYRNMFPGASQADLPDQVKEFKLQDRNPGHGDIWGSKQWYAGMYSVPPSTDFILYLMDVYKSETAAKDEMESSLTKDCKKSDAQPMRFTFQKDGKEIGEGATCFAGFYILKDSRVVTIAKVGDSISIEDMKEFMENLPFVAGAKMVSKDKE